jgi:hypothetical protein
MVLLPRGGGYTLPCLNRKECHKAEVLELRWTVLYWLTAACAPFAHKTALFAGSATQELSDLALETARMVQGEGPATARRVVRRVTGLLLLWDAAERRRLLMSGAGSCGSQGPRAFSLPKVVFVDSIWTLMPHEKDCK